MIARAQKGKGSGRRVDADGNPPDYSSAYAPDEIVNCKMFVSYGGKRQAGKLMEMPYRDALVMERYEHGRVTYKGVEICGTPEHR